VKTLKQTQAKLIFATITPVPEHVLFVSRRTEDVPIYNAVALKIMSEEQIPVDDLYAIALPRLPEIQWPNDVHFAPEGNEVLGHRAATAITYMLMSLKPKR
jgi:acyl-CoA thioesterase-1